MTSEPQTHKNTVKKGGRIPWWHKLIDDNVRNDQQFPRDTIRRDDWNVNLTLKADRFRQRSSGHGAQGLNKRHIMRVWDPESKIISEGQTSSRMDLANLNKDEDLTAVKKRKPRHKKPRDKWSLHEKSVLESCDKHNRGNGEQTICSETPENIAIRRPDITKNELLEKEANDDFRLRKQQDIFEEDIDDWTTRGIIESKATDQELDNDDKYWDTMTHIEESEVI